MKKYFNLILIIILEIVISKYLNNYISPIFTYLYVILISSNIKNNNKYIFLIISGLIYDIVLSTYFIHTFLFITIDYINKLITKNMNKNKIITFISFFIYVFLYRIIGFIIFILIKYKEVSLIYFIESITLSLANIIFYYILVIINKSYVK